MQDNNTENPADILKDYDEWHKQMKSSGETASSMV